MTDQQATIVPVREAHDLSIHAVVRESHGTVGYVVVLNRSAVAIDPDWHVTDFTHCASSAGKRIARVFETHTHSDRLSGASSIVRTMEATHYLHPFDAIDLESRQFQRLPFDFLEHGRRLSIDGGVFEVLHLPGHTLGHCGLVLNGRYLFSGELLLRDETCQPDVDANYDVWAGQIYRSLCRIALLPDRLVVLPCRLGCGAPFESRPLGDWRSDLPVLGERPPSEVEFVSELKKRRDESVPAANHAELCHRILRVNRGLEPLDDPSNGVAIDRQLACQ